MTWFVRRLPVSSLATRRDLNRRGASVAAVSFSADMPQHCVAGWQAAAGTSPIKTTGEAPAPHALATPWTFLLSFHSRDARKQKETDMALALEKDVWGRRLACLFLRVRLHMRAILDSFHL